MLDGAVQITASAGAPCRGVQLVWTSRAPADLPLMDAFPIYEHELSSDDVGNRHVFTLPVSDEATVGQAAAVKAAIPVGRLIHARARAVVECAEGWRPVCSDDISFRVIRDRLGRLREGLIFEEGPRVLAVSEREAVIQWRLNAPAASTFYHGREADRMAAQSGETLGNTGRAAVTDLKPDRRYFYRVRSTDPDSGDVLESPLLSFQTAPSSGEDFSFALIGSAMADPRQLNPDMSVNGVNVAVLNRCAQSAWRQGARFLLCMGNQISGHTGDARSALLEYRTWQHALSGVNHFIPVYTIMGRSEATAPWRIAGQTRAPGDSAEALFASLMVHPLDGPDAPPSLPPYKENVYTFSFAGARFIILNSEYNSARGMKADDDTARTIDRTQRIWLRGQLEQFVHAPWLFVAFHATAWPVAGGWGDALDRLPGVRDQVWETIDNFDADAVFCGQEANYSHLVLDRRVNAGWMSAIHQFNVGAGGAPLDFSRARPPYAAAIQNIAPRPHYLLVRIEGRRAFVQACAPDGTAFDLVELRRKKR
ncbi:MAG: hypothetical protein Kow0059_06160 [Candidatus Sumerlaeia bacterium]